MKLTKQQVQFFRQSGFLKLPRLFDEITIKNVRKLIRNYRDNMEKPYQIGENGDIVRISNIYVRDILLRKLLKKPQLIGCLEGLLGPNIELLLNRHNHATFNAKGQIPVRLHRDVLQWSRSIVTCIIYIDRSTVENGCTFLIPCSQYLPFVGTPNNGGTWMDEHSKYADLIDQALPVPMEPGTVLVFDSLAFHTVGKNSTDGERMSITAGYTSVDELAGEQLSDSRVLVRGERIYRGNDATRGGDVLEEK